MTAPGGEEDTVAQFERVATGESAACVLAPASPSVGHAIVLVGDDIPLALPSLETAKRDLKSGRKFLRVASGMLRHGNGEGVAIACLVPSTLSERQFRRSTEAATSELVAHLDSRRGIRLSLTEGELARASRELPIVVLAGRIAVDIAAGMEPGAGLTRYLRSDSSADGEVAGYWGGYHLPAVTITATAGSIITHASAIYWTLHQFSRWSDQGLRVEEEYPSGFCPSQSERWIALNEEVNRVRDDSIAMASAMSGLTDPLGERCVIQGDNKKVCVDFFIMSAWAFVLKGDNRTFDPDAPYGASRAQLYLDLDSLKARAYISGSSAGLPPLPGGFLDFPGAEWQVAPYVHQPKDIRLERLADGTVKLTVELYNGFCTFAGRALCPAIDAQVIFFKNSSGDWTTNAESVARDKYPSMIVYRQNGTNSWSEVWKDPEGSFWQLIGVAKMKEELEEERDETLGGCQLE
jgi:hypothetical protein